MSNNILFAIKCKLCHNEFVYCIYSKNDFRCYECKNKKHTTVEDVEKELKEMNKEEYEQFIQDIKEYEEEFGKINYDEEDDDL